jgi:hypothetical protein
LKKIAFLSLSLVLMIVIPGCFTFQTPSPNPVPPAGTPPANVVFSNNPATINAGGSSTLVWNVTGATSVSIDQGIGLVDVAGFSVVSPAASTSYTLSATNSAGTVTRSVVTTVNSVAPPTAPVPIPMPILTPAPPPLSPAVTPPTVSSPIPAKAATLGPAPVVLGSSSTFTVLAGSTITNTGATMVNGDLGLNPGTAVTGFPPGILKGTKHVSDPIAAQAKLDLTTAYNNAAGRTLAPVTLAGNIGGRTLAPGLYKSTSSLAISSGDLTLDAQGDANAVFIFQIASTLTTTSGRKVILSGGAQARNIFWQVGTSATLGTTSVFKGTIMADQAITMTTGATLEGRALARIGAVTLDSNTITTP